MEDKLDSLQRLWDITTSLKGIDNEEAFVARGRWPKSQLRTQRVQSHSPENQVDFRSANQNNCSPKARARGFRCYTCKSEDHRVDSCPYQEGARAWALNQRLKDEKYERRGLNRLKSSGPSKYLDRPSKDRHVHFKSHNDKKGKAYVAHTVDSEEYNSETSTEHEDDDIIEDGLMALEQKTSLGERTHHSLLSVWHADTAALSHTTDDPKNFRGPQRPTHCTIKVGGGKLFCRKIGDASMVTKEGVALLKDYLFVPGLGANLMSVRKVCAHAGLKGHFDGQKLFLTKNNNIVLIASNDNGVYSVDSVFPITQNEIAFNSQNSQDACLYSRNTIESEDIQMASNDPKDCTNNIDLQNPIWSRKELMHKNHHDTTNATKMR
ncbi:hypothetical protein EPUL_003229, partial [Erysiphe pulchra]